MPADALNIGGINTGSTIQHTRGNCTVRKVRTLLPTYSFSISTIYECPPHITPAHCTPAGAARSMQEQLFSCKMRSIGTPYTCEA